MKTLRALVLLAALATALPCATSSGEPSSLAMPAGPVVARIHYQTEEQLGELTSTLDVWEVHPAESVLVARLDPVQLALLTAEGYAVEVDEAKTALLYEVRVPLPGQVNAIPGYPCYRTVEETYAAYDALVASYPGLVTKVDIGDSWDKLTPGGPPGYDLWALRVTSAAIPGPKPRFFLVAEVHAREYTTAETAIRFVEFLLERYGVDPDVTWLLDRCELHVVPMANPDGRKFAEGGDLWRKNTDNDDGCTTPGAYGTDLNRNHSFKWNQGGSSGSPCAETYRGPSAGSEPEVQAIQAYVASLFPDQRGPADTDPAPPDATGLLITLHSYGGLVLWPWGFTSTPAPNGTALQTLGRKLAYFNAYTPEQSVTLYPTSGSTDDWSYGELGIASYTIEMGTQFFESCSPFEGTIWPANRNALLYALKACRRPYQTPAGPEPVNVQVSPQGTLPGGVLTLTATLDDTRFRSGTGEPVQAIAEARWTADAPSFVTGTPTSPMSPTDGAFNSPLENVQALIDTSGWSPGRHLLFVEGKDAEGNWGVPAAAFVCVSAAASAVGVSPSSVAGSGNPGATVDYTLTVTNLGTSTETLAVALSGHAWQVTAPASLGPLAPCASATFTVSVSVPAEAQACSTDAVTVNVTAAGGSATAVVLTTVNPAAGPPITAPEEVCSLSSGNSASVPDAGPGATYAWSIAGGTITAGDGTPAITFTAGASGVVTLSVLVTETSSCALSGPATIGIVPPPVVAITGTTSLCTGDTLTLVAEGAGLVSYQWSRDGLDIPGANSATYAKASATSSDSGTYRVRAANAAGCTGASPPVAVVVASEPQTSIADVAWPEGNSGVSDAVFTVSLSVPACAPSSIAFEATGGTAMPGVDFQAVSGTLEFARGQQSRTLAVPVLGDRVAENDETFFVDLSAPAGLSILRGRATGTILNDDVAGIVVAPTSGLVVSETGSTATFKITLTSQPTADVVVALTSSDPTEGKVSGNVTLTPTNWSAGATATVTGIDDFVIDGNQAFTITTSPVASLDPFYAGIDPADVAAVNLDDDVAGFAISPTSGLKTTEDGGTSSFVVALSCQPAGPVTLPLRVVPPSEALVSPVSITFKPDDWSIPRLVTLTGVSDGVPRTYSVVTDPATSSDPAFSGLNPPDVSATNLGTGVGMTERVGLAVDVHPGTISSSNLNGVLEAGEIVILEPTWRNTRPTARKPFAELGELTGPQAAGTRYRTTAVYPTLAPGQSASCYDPANPASCYAVWLRPPSPRLLRHWDVRIDETVDGHPTTWVLHVGESFVDVPPSHWAYRFVETLFHNGITAGCSETSYCPTAPLSRAEMAVLLLVARHGPGYAPPPATGTLFADVPADHWAARFIEALAAEGITAGCGAGLYCPDNPISRAEMAVFLLVAEHGTGWGPPAPSGTLFADVPADYWAAAFIEALVAEGITGGCAPGLYCPASPVTRAEMAVFLAATFGLTLY
ncbi:MAG TPA: M14 family zinc carboxypeptidase [Thermoanaerobaculaceae bacterium]|nr:M14 family zinc carboxypeptidase [Thermoanaerobaculaceae bacterium]HRS15101.1 M14 family zinc carboxypeptidase [Thermoanaerobaculaceae bacterium]